MDQRPEESSQRKKVAQKYFNKCPSSLAVRKMQIKRILMFHLTPVKIDKNQQDKVNISWGEFGGRKTLIHCYWT